MPFDAPLTVGEGDAIELELEGAPFGDGLVWRWSARGSSGVVAAHCLDLVALTREA